jgi:hypothetical protein
MPLQRIFKEKVNLLIFIILINLTVFSFTIFNIIKRRVS